MAVIIDQPAAAAPAAATARREGLAFAAAACLLSLVVRVPTLGRPSLWYDEVLTANVVAGGWADVITERLSRGHFPTYFLLVKALGLGGAPDALLRLPSALFGSIAAALYTWLAYRLGGRIAALASLVLFAFMPNLFYYGQEARPYALLLLFLGIATLAEIELLGGRGEPRRLGIVATVGSIGAALSIPAGIASVALLHLSLLAGGAGRLPPPARRALRLHVIVTWVVIALASLALVPGVVGLSEEPQGLMKWQYATTAFDRIAEAWSETYGFWVREDVDRYLPAGWEIVPSLVFTALVLAGFWLRRRDRVIRYLAGSVFGTPLAFLLIGSITATSGRYLIGMLPPAIVLGACGAAALAERWRLALAAVLALAGLMLALQTLDASLSDSRYDWRRLGRFMAANGIRDVEIMTNNRVAPVSLDYYLPAGSGIAWNVAREPPATIDAVWEWARGRETAWLLLFYRDGPLPDDVVRGRTVCRWHFSYGDLFVLTHDPSELPAPLEGCAGS